MLTASRTRLPLALLILLLAVAGTILALSSQLGYYAHLIWLALAVGLGLLVWTYRGNFADGVLVWLILTALFPAHFWRMDLPGFFNVTVGRIGILLLGVLFLLRSFVRGLPRLPMVIVGLMVALTAYFSLSAWHAGWTLSITGAPPYYRLFVGYIFPFAAFIFTLAGFANGSSCDPHVSAQRRERFIARTLWFFAIFGVYLTFTAFCEHYELWSLVWPRFISKSSVGLNFGRARGPFAEAFAMALTLSFLFFVILFLARRCRTPMRIVLWTFDLFVLLGIYFTYTRTAYICLIISGAVWLWLVAGRLRRTAAISIIAAAIIVAVAVNWATVSSKERTAGGLAEMRPIVGRIAVSRMALRLVAEEPLLGVGFGHYRQAIRYRQMDVASTTSVYARNLNQSVAVLSVLCETGLVGLILYLAVFFALLVPSVRFYRRCIPGANGFISRDFVVLFWILYIQTALMSVTADPSYYPYTTGLLMFFAGLVAGLEFSTPPEPAKSADIQAGVPVVAEPSVR